MDNKAKQPEDPTPQSGGSPAGSEHAEHGIPPDATEATPTGLPDSGRHETEVTPAKQ